MAEKTLIEKISEIVNTHDPLYLLKMGCPSDEYNPEIERILPALEEARNKKELHNKVYKIFIEMFDKDMIGPKKDYKQMSEEIFELKAGEETRRD